MVCNQLSEVNVALKHNFTALSMMKYKASKKHLTWISAKKIKVFFPVNIPDINALAPAERHRDWVVVESPELVLALEDGERIRTLNLNQDLLKVIRSP